MSSNYTALSLRAVDEHGAEDHRAKGRAGYKTMTLETGEFKRRILVNVLPAGFPCIRHHGHPGLSIPIATKPATALVYFAVSSIGLIRRLPKCAQACTSPHPMAGIE
ncbi:transposase [Paraburkholderia humisilvae]|uniref:transposase n=1 Tax=Paraburkholderia humisilvae TaxID=627669 RepID=UPI001FEC0EC5|nr:transposase [Paraburkholderia humisilvae]